MKENVLHNISPKIGKMKYKKRVMLWKSNTDGGPGLNGHHKGRKGSRSSQKCSIEEYSTKIVSIDTEKERRARLIIAHANGGRSRGLWTARKGKNGSQIRWGQMEVILGRKTTVEGDPAVRLRWKHGGPKMHHQQGGIQVR